MQPPPQPNDRSHITNLVMQDLRDRKHLGIQRYGTALQAFNGRNSLQDAFEESLDLSLYLKKWLEEKATLMYWLEQLFEAHDRADDEALLEAVERLRSLNQKM